MKQPLTRLQSTCVPLLLDNIDTDQIIPARFLKATGREGFGENLFRDWRYDSAGRPLPFVMNDAAYRGASILVAGENFGCGSSREHAAWAIADAGFRVVIAKSFADIHRQNELNNFVLPLQVSPEFHAALAEAIQQDASTTVTIDLPRQTVTLDATGLTEHFSISGYKKYCLLHALDDIDFLLETQQKILRYETEHCTVAR